MSEEKLSEPSRLPSAIEEFAKWTGGDWQNLRQAHSLTQGYIKDLKTKLENLDNQDTSIVVFGSLARGEATSASDIDWTLLVDGRADPKHLAMAQEIRKKLPEDKQPGVEGIFGNLAFSHQILHCIGGEEDSNANTTRRILLLLESRPIGNKDAWESVQKNILRRYVDEDQGLLSKTNSRGVPLFLLNDIARYWRIMVVDFAYKQRERENQGYALRNIKLGLSRKLIYASGILACFSCDLDFPEKSLFRSDNPQKAIEHLRTVFCKTPLEIVATALNRYDELREPSKRLFDSYDRFIGFLGDNTSAESVENVRVHLKNLPVSRMETDPVFQEGREIRHDFGEALKEIFLKRESPIQQLMIERGVF